MICVRNDAAASCVGRALEVTYDRTAGGSRGVGRRVRVDAGIRAAAAVALPFAALPIITVGTAVALGVGVASGVASGRNAPPPD